MISEAEKERRKADLEEARRAAEAICGIFISEDGSTWTPDPTGELRAARDRARRSSAANVELNQARLRIRELEAECDRLRKDLAAAEEESKEAWARIVRMTFEEGNRLSVNLLRRLIKFVHPDKHQKSSPEMQAAAHDLTVELLKLRNEST